MCACSKESNLTLFFFHWLSDLPNAIYFKVPQILEHLDPFVGQKSNFQICKNVGSGISCSVNYEVSDTKGGVR